MSFFLAVGTAILIVLYLLLQCLLHVTQSTREPSLVESKVPFIDPVIGMAKYQAKYLASLGYVDTARS